MAKKTFVNKTASLQVVYDEGMNKYEVVPGGTVQLDETVGQRFSGVLEVVKTTAKAADTKADTK